MNTRIHRLIALGVLTTASLALAHDWPFWRGPEQNGLAREKAVVTNWSESGENLLWRVPEGGRTTPIVMDGRVYVTGPVGSGMGLQERVLCVDAETGKTLWEHRINVFHTDIVENRVGWPAPVGDAETGNVYVHGTGGELICLDRNGRVVWSVSMTEMFGRVSGYGGRLGTPIIDEDRVIVDFLCSSWGSFAKPSHRYLAMDKRTGQVLWWASPGGMPEDTTYSCPIVAVIGGERMLIAGNADGMVYGMRARTGEMLWKFDLSKRGLNVSCVADGDYVYAAHSEENHDNTAMGRVVCIDARQRGDITKTGEVWRFDGHTVGYASPALANGRLYVIDNSANMYCLDAKTGSPHWSHSLGRVGKGSPVVTTDGVIYATEQTGVFHILKDEGDSVTELDRDEFTRDDGLVVEIFGSPAVANGRVYFQTRYHTYCLGEKDAKVTTEPIPALAKETAPGAGATEYLQVIPGEITIEPGGQVQFAARRYASGVRQDDPQVTWSVKGIKGTIDASGRFTAASDQAFSAGMITANGNGIDATARVRIDPTIPMLEDFEEMTIDQPPPGWIGVVGKTKVIDLDGNKVLLKMAPKEQPKPPFMRIRGYAMPPIAGGYTVEADVFATEKKPIFKPDFGLINSRYRLFIRGMANSLRIDSWAAEPRIQEDVAFQFSPDTWYHMKFQVSDEGDHAMIRGKVWPKDSSEPDHWTIEVKDTHPNREGSPGIYVYSVGTTEKSDGPLVYYDNFQVKRND